MYVKAKVYISVSSWGSQSCSTGSQQIITTTTNGSVRKEEGSYTKYNSSWSSSYEACDGSTITHRSSYGDGCSCSLDTSDPTGYCVKSGSGYCGSQVSSAICNSSKGYTQKCYYIKCVTNATHTSSGCNSGFDSWSDSGCGSQTTHCYYTTSSFKDSNSKSNWNTSLSNAGGYAKEVYIYSYPQRVYIEYNGNGADSICGDGNASSWASGYNTYNSNTSIKYTDGNPVCNTSLKSGSMVSASNSNSTTYISKTSGGSLKENEYYKVGYDFKGWSTSPNGSAMFKDKQYISASQVNGRGGDTITLYAVWEKHTYNVTYSYLCGSISNIVYQYGDTTALQDLDVSSCKKSDSNTEFIGWYEDISYTKKVDSISSDDYKDKVLYAKLKETRYFNYQTGSWEYTK